MKYDMLLISDKAALLEAQAKKQSHLFITHTGRIFNVSYALEKIDQLEKEKYPDEFQTIYGYPVKELVLVATMLREQGFTTEDIHKAAMSWSDGAMMAFTAAQKQIEEGFMNTIKTMKEGK